MIINRRNSASRHFERSALFALRSVLRSEKSLFALSSLILIASAWTLPPPASTADLPFGPWTRAANEPILSPQGTTWESAGTFNPAVVLQRQIRHALPRPGRLRHFPPRLRRKHRRPPLHSPPRAGALPRSPVRKRRRRRRSPPPEIRRHLVPHLHRLQQKRRPALPRHLARSHPLGPQRRDPSRLPRKLEQRLDQVRRHRPRKNRRQVLD